MRRGARRPLLLTAWIVFVGLLVAACSLASSPPAEPAAGAPGAAPPPAPVAAANGPSATAPAPSTPATPPERVTLRVGTPGRPDQAHLQLALDRGYFTAQGLDVETVLITSGAEMVPALATNQIQVGNGAPSAALFNALARGVNIRLVADFAHAGPPSDTVHAIVVRKELWDSGAVRSAADLKGGRVFAGIGVSGTISDRLLIKALAQEGTNADGIELQYMPIPDIYAALANGRIDAGSMTEPLTTQAVQQGVATVLYPVGAVIPGAILSVLQYSAQFATEQPDAATRFMVGYLHGVRDYHDAFVLQKDRDAAINTLLESMSPKDRRMWETAHYITTDQNGAIDVNDLMDSAEFYLQQGEIAGPLPDFSKFIDTRFAEAAAQILGRR
jgi:NitT/TauT family transport system substrate-binding protein